MDDNELITPWPASPCSAPVLALSAAAALRAGGLALRLRDA